MDVAPADGLAVKVDFRLAPVLWGPAATLLWLSETRPELANWEIQKMPVALSAQIFVIP